MDAFLMECVMIFYKSSRHAELVSASPRFQGVAGQVRNDGRMAVGVAGQVPKDGMMGVALFALNLCVFCV